MSDAVRKPCEEVEGRTLMSGEYIAEVGAIEDVLKCWQHLHPYGRPVFAGYESGTVSLGIDRRNLRMYLAE